LAALDKQAVAVAAKLVTVLVSVQVRKESRIQVHWDPANASLADRKSAAHTVAADCSMTIDSSQYQRE